MGYLVAENDRTVPIVPHVESQPCARRPWAPSCRSSDHSSGLPQLRPQLRAAPAQTTAPGCHSSNRGVGLSQLRPRRRAVAAQTAAPSCRSSDPQRRAAAALSRPRLRAAAAQTSAPGCGFLRTARPESWPERNTASQCLSKLVTVAALSKQ